MKLKTRMIERGDGSVVFTYSFLCEDGRNVDEFAESLSSARSCVKPMRGVKYLVGYTVDNKSKQFEPRIVFSDDRELIERGWPGNSNPHLHLFHGWRGTNDDIAFYGYGVRECLSVSIITRRSSIVRIVFGKDLVSDKS